MDCRVEARERSERLCLARQSVEDRRWIGNIEYNANARLTGCAANQLCAAQTSIVTRCEDLHGRAVSYGVFARQIPDLCALVNVDANGVGIVGVCGFRYEDGREKHRLPAFA